MPAASIWLDLLGRERNPAVADFEVTIDHIVAGGDANILLQTAVRETPSGIAGGGVLVKWPVVPAGLIHYNFFTPDICGGGHPCPAIVGQDFFATGTHPENPTLFNFAGLDSGGGRTETGIVAGGNIIITAANPSPSAAHINVRAVTDILALGHIDILTNGWILDFEKHGDLRVGDITSTDDDVTLWSPRRIVDALSDFAADVTGRNITMTAGINSLGQAEGVGGIGERSNFLEINVDATQTPGGVLNAFDFAAPITDGVFLTETLGRHDRSTPSRRTATRRS